MLPHVPSFNSRRDFLRLAGSGFGALALAALETELSIPAERIVPVCLKSEAVYNVSESLIPVMLETLPDAERTLLLRLLREYHDGEYWSQLRRQAFNSGRLLVSAAAHLFAPLINAARRSPPEK